MTPLWDCHVNSNAATTTFPTTTPIVLGVAGANRRRKYEAYSIADYWTAGTLQFKLTANITTNHTVVAFPVVHQLTLMDGTDMSYNNVDQSAGTAWTRPATLTTGAGSDPGGNVNTSVRATFAVTTAMTGGSTPGSFLYYFSDTVAGSNINSTTDSLASVINVAIKASIEAGLTYFVLMWVHEDETTGAGSMNIATIDDTDVSDRPSLTGTGIPAIYGFIFESDLNAGFAGEQKGDATIVMNDLDFDTGDVAYCEYGTAAEFVSGTGLDVTANVNISAKVAGNVIEWIDLPTYIPDYQWRPVATVRGVTYKGTPSALPVIPEALHGGAQIDMYRGDSHEIVVRTGISTVTEALDVQAATDVHINARIAANPNVVRSVRFHDGGYAFGQFTNSANAVFPQAGDGTGRPAENASIGYAQSQADTDEVARMFRRYSYLASPTFFHEQIHANHDPNMKAFRTANNSESNNAEVWAMNSKILHKTAPTGLNTSTGVHDFKGEAIGRWYARPWGNYLHCVLNAGCESLYGQTNAVAVPSPINGSMQDAGDWTLGSSQFNFFFHATTGQLAVNAAAGASMFPNVVIDIHNLTATTPGNINEGFLYGRTAPDNHGTGEWWDTIHPAIVATKGAANVAVVTGHDHNWDWGFEDGILYIWLPTPGQIGAGGVPTGPYNKGFTGIAGGAADDIHRGVNFRYNAGWVELHSSLTGLTFKYYATEIVTSPNPYTINTGVGDGGLVDQVSVPEASGGRGRGGRGRGRGRIDIFA